MSKKLKIAIVVLSAIIAASIIPGCVDQEIPLPSPTPKSSLLSPTPTSTHPSTSPSPSPIATPELSEMLKLPNAMLIFTDAQIGSKKITVVHHGGDTIYSAFKNAPPHWDSLEIWINDQLFQGTMTLNRAPVSTSDFSVGDELELFLEQELTDCYIFIIYSPTGTILMRGTFGNPTFPKPTIPSTIGRPTPIPGTIVTPQSPQVSLILDTTNYDKMTLIHNGGEPIVHAFKGESPYWNSLMVKINGAVYTGTVKLNGATISAGDFVPGDELEFFFDHELTKGDTITIIHVPSKEVLQRVVLR